MSESETSFERGYDREMFRSSVFSSLWAAMTAKKPEGFRMTDLAARLGKDKGYISRLFSNHENCKLNTISDLAHALDADIRIEIVDRKTGLRYGPAGPMRDVPVPRREIVTRIYRMGAGSGLSFHTSIVAR